jgi:hypothetical protein
VVVEVMHLMDSIHGSAATEGVIGEPESAVSYWNGVLLAIVGDFICPPGDIELCLLLLVSNVVTNQHESWTRLGIPAEFRILPANYPRMMYMPE